VLRWLPAGPSEKSDVDTGLILFNSDAVMVGQQPVVACARTEGIEQDHLQIAAMDGELRMLVARCPSQRLPINQLTEAIEEGRVLGLGSRPAPESASSPSAASSLVACGSRLMPTPIGLNFGRPIQKSGRESGGVQCEPQRQSADPGPRQ